MCLRSQLARVLLGLAICAGISPAYYHFLHFASRTGPFKGLPERFDLNTLPNKTLSYVISEGGMVQLRQNDSFTGLVSQIRAAAKAWNDVETSELKLAFGGISSAGSQSSSPSLEITFSEVPPGVVALGGPMIRGDANGSFVPILKSVVMVQPDLTQRASYSEELFGTLVHEIGHALGLQHTFTSSVMSTAPTRATTKARPLATDDIAGISLLYPKASFFLNTGSISGRVTLGGTGTNLASVVAVSPNGPVVSTLTNPDGSYRIDGVPPRQYLLYVHPLPPATKGQTTPGDIVYPVDNAGVAIGGGATFDTIFYPGTNSPAQAFPITVAAGSNTENINFSVRQRSAVALHTVSMYAFPGNIAVQPPYLNPVISRPFLVGSGYGLVSNNAPSSGLSVGILGGSNLAVRPYSVAPSGFIQLDMDIRSFTFAGDSPRHLVFSLSNDLYVLPSAFIVTEKMPPVVNTIAAAADGTRSVLIKGSNLSQSTRVLFDGVDGTVRSWDEAAGQLLIVPPVAPSGHKANVVALNPDGQSSLFMQEPPVYEYPADLAALPATTTVITPSALPAGVESLVQIDSTGIEFVDGKTEVAFGSSDIVAKRVWVVSPNRLLANVWVRPTAQVALASATVVSGLQLAIQSSALMVQPSNSRQVWLESEVINVGNGQAVLSPGATGLVRIANTPEAVSSNSAVFLNDRPVSIVGLQTNQILFQVPASATPGPATLRVDIGANRGLPIVIQIVAAPPRITAAASGTNQTIDATRPLKAGEILVLNVANLAASGSFVDASQVDVKIGSIALKAGAVLEQNGVFRVMVATPLDLAAGVHSVSVGLQDRVSDPYSLQIIN